MLHGEDRSTSQANRIGPPICEQSRNRVPNPGFEQGTTVPDTWVIAGKCDVWVDYPGHNSVASALIDAENGTKKSCAILTPIDRIPVTEGQSYEYAAWVKTDLDTGSANVVVTFWKRHGTWKMVGDPVHTAMVSGKGEGWKQLTGWVQVPVGAQYARVEATLNEHSEGSVWFDDIRFALDACLEISKSGDPEEIAPGQLLTYTISVTNVGNEAVNGVNVIETYDEDAQPKPDLFQPPASFDDNRWIIPRLAPDESDTIVVVVQAKDGTRDRRWLYNRVEAFSSETPVRVSSEISTRVNMPTGSCSIYIDLAERSQVALPGQNVFYQMLLRNTGDYAGQAVLITASSLGWDDSLEPETCFLSIGGVEPVTFGLTVPLSTCSPETNTSLITATLLCNIPGIENDMETEAVNTRIALPVFLPAIMRDYRDPSSWESEPNDLCGYEEADGPLLPDKQYYGHPDDDWDWFRIDFSASRLVLTLDIEEPMKRGVQMGLFYDDCTCPNDPGWWDNTPEDGYLIDLRLSPGTYFLGIFVDDPVDQDYEHPYTLQMRFF